MQTAEQSWLLLAPPGPGGDGDVVPIGDPDDDEGYGDEDEDDEDEDEDDEEEPWQVRARHAAWRAAQRPLRAMNYRANF